MTNVKFRGKRGGNGEWVYGYYHACIGNGEMLKVNWTANGGRDLLKKSHYFNIHWILVPHTPSDSGWDIRETFTPYEVYPDSVGLFTGLYDKNKTEIYEGDIVDFGMGQLTIRKFIEHTFQLKRMIDDRAVVEIVGNVFESESYTK